MQAKNIIASVLTKKIKMVILIFLAIIVGVMAKVFSALIIRNIIDRVILESGPLLFWTTMFFIAVLLSVGLDIYIKNASLAIGTEISNALAKAVYSAAIRAEISELKKIDTDEIVKRIGVDCDVIGNKYIANNWLAFIQMSLFLLTVFISMIVIDPALGLLTFVTLPLVYMIVKTTDKFIGKVNEKAMAAQEERCRMVREDFEKVRSIKLKNGIIREEDEFERKSESFFKLYRNIGTLKEAVNFKVYDLFVGVALAIVLALGGYFALGDKKPGTIVAFVILTPYVYTTFKRLLSLKINPSTVRGEMKAIDDILALRSEIKAEPITSLQELHTLKFENVTYNSGDERIENVSFDVRRGEKLGIISVSGNGHKIIFDLFTKLLRPRDGVISINNCDINKISTLYLRDLITAVPQDDNLFSDTIINNITYPLPFDEYKYNDALHKSGLKEYIATLENKDQTLVDGFSDELMQRITLANAFYKDSKIFVFNEATSALAVREEDAIMNEIFKLNNKLVVIMTDKIYYIAKCDKILILENDQVVEYGKTAELLQDRGSLLSRLIKKVRKVSAS